MRTILLLSLLISSQIAAKEPLRLEYPEVAESIIKPILPEIRSLFVRLDQPVKFIPLPAKRGIQMLQSQHLDGSLVRGINKDYLPVPTSLFTVSVGLYVRDDSTINSKNWKQFSLLTIRGFEIAQRTYPDITWELVNTTEQALHMLNVQRADVFIFIDQLVSSSPVIPHSNVRKLETVISDFPVHLHLHKKHQALIPQLDALLKSLDALLKSKQ